MPVVKPRDATVYWATLDVPEALEEAKKFIKSRRFTHDDVRLVRREGMIVVEERKHD